MPRGRQDPRRLRRAVPATHKLRSPLCVLPAALGVAVPVCGGGRAAIPTASRHPTLTATAATPTRLPRRLRGRRHSARP